jgi:hypothetical protein
MFRMTARNSKTADGAPFNARESKMGTKDGAALGV